MVKTKKVKVQKSKIKSNIELINPKKLSERIKSFGENITAKEIVMKYISTILLAVSIGFIFKLQLPIIVALVISAALFVPFFIYDGAKEKYEKKRFEEASNYISTMLQNFTDTNKILESLKRTRVIYEDESQFTQTIDSAISTIEKSETEGENNVHKKALALIEKNFPSKRIKMLHEMLLMTEEKGGDIEKTKKILLIDKQNWIKLTDRVMTSKRKSFLDLKILAIAGLALCASINISFSAIPNDFGKYVVANPLYQFSTLITCVLTLLIVKKASKKLTDDYIVKDNVDDSDPIVEDYEKLKNYNLTEKQIKYGIFSAPFFLGALVVYGLHLHIVITIILALIGLFLAFAPKLNYHLLHKDVKNNLLKTFPIWMVQMNLLLQSNNVRNALQISKENAPSLIRHELERIIPLIQEDSENVNNYLTFFDFFEINEIRTMMQTLYGISINGTTDLEDSLNSLFEINSYIQQKAEDILASDEELSMENFERYPNVLFTMTLVCYLFTFLTAMIPLMTQLSNNI